MIIFNIRIINRSNYTIPGIHKFLNAASPPILSSPSFEILGTSKISAYEKGILISKISKITSLFITLKTKRYIKRFLKSKTLYAEEK